jgi:uncharacterized protein (TIGR00297 family)
VAWHSRTLDVLGGVVLSLCYGKWVMNQANITVSGAVAGWVVLIMTCFSGIHFGLVLFTCAYLSHCITLSSNARKLIDERRREEKVNWVQVLANFSTGTLVAVVFSRSVTRWHVPHQIALYHWACSLLAAFIGHYACHTGITWATQIGGFSQSPPYLITNLQKVPRGTKGGITVLGTGIAMLGGLVTGVAFYIADIIEHHGMGVEFLARPALFPVIQLGVACGLIGYLVYSLIGATLQFSGWSETKKAIVNSPGIHVIHISGVDLLNNQGVLFLSTFVTSIIASQLSGIFLLLDINV